jgi:hypothetical protein
LGSSQGTVQSPSRSNSRSDRLASHRPEAAGLSGGQPDSGDSGDRQPEEPWSHNSDSEEGNSDDELDLESGPPEPEDLPEDWDDHPQDIDESSDPADEPPDRELTPLPSRQSLFNKNKRIREAGFKRRPRGRPFKDPGAREQRPIEDIGPLSPSAADLEQVADQASGFYNDIWRGKLFFANPSDDLVNWMVAFFGQFAGVRPPYDTKALESLLFIAVGFREAARRTEIGLRKAVERSRRS